MKSRNISHGKETIDLNRLLEVSTVQIGSILEEGALSIDKLAKEFTKIGKTLEEIRPMIPKIDSSDNAPNIILQMEDISDSVNNALVSFQFYDRLTQRLQHVIHGINIVSKGIESRGCAGNWDDLYHEIRDSYTLTEEQSVFEVMMGKRSSSIESDISNKQKVDLF